MILEFHRNFEFSTNWDFVEFQMSRRETIDQNVSGVKDSLLLKRCARRAAVETCECSLHGGIWRATLPTFLGAKESRSLVCASNEATRPCNSRKVWPGWGMCLRTAKTGPTTKQEWIVFQRTINSTWFRLLLDICGRVMTSRHWFSLATQPHQVREKSDV